MNAAEILDKIRVQIDKLPNWARYAIIASGMPIIILVYYYAIRIPVLDELSAAQDAMRKVQTEFEDKQAIANDLEEWQREVQRLTGVLTEALSRLPTNIGYDMLLISVPNVAKKNALEVTSFKIESDSPRGDYAEIPMIMKLTGNFFGLGRFAQELGEHPRIMKLETFKIKSASKGGTAQTPGAKADDTYTPIEVEARLMTYRFIDKSASAPAAKPGARPAPGGGKK